MGDTHFDTSMAENTIANYEAGRLPRTPENELAYNLALAEREMSGAANRAINPDAWARQQAARAAGGLSAPADRLVSESEALMPALLAGARRTAAANPYNQQLADRSRDAQMALIQQMRGQMSGPSLAGMQGTRALSQVGQSAAMRGALGGGRGAMLGAANATSELAGDVGQARLAEVMRSQSGMGGVVGGLRGSDLSVAGAKQGMGLRAQELADTRARSFATAGTGLSDMNRGAQLELYKMLQRLRAAKRQQADVENKQLAEGIGTAIKTAVAL